MLHTKLLAGGANGLIIVIEDDAHLVHQADLLLIVTLERIAPRIDVGEEAEDRLGRDGLGGNSSGSHVVGGYEYFVCCRAEAAAVGMFWRWTGTLLGMERSF